MKRLYVMLFSVVAMLFSAGSAYAYQVSISVSSSLGDPVIGASYSVNGQEDVYLGLDGTATIQNLTGITTIEVKAPGFESQSRTVSSSSHLDFSLNPSSSSSAVTLLVTAIKASNNQVEISGQLVSSSSGDGIFGQITNLSDNESWSTNLDGSFNFTVQKGTSVRFDASGYQSEVRQCNSSSNWMISMQEE